MASSWRSQSLHWHIENITKSSCLKPLGLEPWYLVCSTIQWTQFQFAQNIALGTKMAPPGGHQGHGQFLIDTYELQVSNKTQVSYPGSLCPLLLCVNTWYAIIVYDKCCFHLKCLLYEGGSICNENPFITPSTNVLGFNAICQTKDQSVAVIMVHEILFYLSKFNKLQTF